MRYLIDRSEVCYKGHKSSPGRAPFNLMSARLRTPEEQLL